MFKDIVKRSLIQIGAIIVALIPLWVYLGVRAFLSPDGFWQELIVLGLGAWVLGIVQVILIILLAIFSFGALWNPSPWKIRRQQRERERRGW